MSQWQQKLEIKKTDRNCGKKLAKIFLHFIGKIRFFILKFAQQIFSVLLFLYKDYFTQNINFLLKKKMFQTRTLYPNEDKNLGWIYSLLNWDTIETMSAYHDKTRAIIAFMTQLRKKLIEILPALIRLKFNRMQFFFVSSMRLYLNTRLPFLRIQANQNIVYTYIYMYIICIYTHVCMSREESQDIRYGLRPKTIENELSRKPYCYIITS